MSTRIVRHGLLLMLTLAACGDDSSMLSIDVITDYVPGLEFTQVDITVNGRALETHAAVLSDGDTYLAGQRVARVPVELGELSVRVTLLRPDGRVLETRTRVGVVSSSLAVTTIFTRNCAEVSCDIGDTCVDEECVPSECSPTNPDACPGGVLCEMSSDCEGDDRMLAACASVECRGSLCLVTPNGDECEGGSTCNPTLGCLSFGDDAGMSDASMPDSGDGTCVAGTPCEGASPCELGTITCLDGVPTCEASGPAAAGVACRASAGPCDIAETCDGTSMTCPANALMTAGSACATGYCDGTNDTCQAGCTPGMSCNTGNPCTMGGLDCASGTPMCMPASNVANGTMCAVQTCGGWGACGGFSDGCDLTGSESRMCTDSTCMSGSCGTSPNVMMRECSRTLTETCDLTDDDCDGQCDEGCRIPVYGFFNGSDHIYQRTSAPPPGYSSEGIRFYLYGTPRTGLIALYRCRRNSDHFLSATPSCESQVVEGILGYVRPAVSPTCDSVILYRFYNDVVPDHFFSRSPFTPGGYVREIDAAQVWTN